MHLIFITATVAILGVLTWRFAGAMASGSDMVATEMVRRLVENEKVGPGKGARDKARPGVSRLRTKWTPRAPVPARAGW